MPLNGDRLNELVHGLHPSEAAEVREFAGWKQDEQLVYLYRELKLLKQTKPFRERVYEFGMVGAWLAYILFDQRGNIPRP